MDTIVIPPPSSYVKKKSHISAYLSAQSGMDASSFALKKKTSNLFRPRFKAQRMIDLRHFNRVLQIDQDRQRVEVEGMTTYADLVAATLPYGYMPAVVPELKTITVGGALSGIGIESSSFRYGLMHETVSQFDVLLSDGRVLDCRPDNEQSDLFYAFPNTYGTLGYALKVTLKLVPVLPYVRLKFDHFHDPQQFFASLISQCSTHRNSGSLAFIDGVIFSASHQVLVSAEMVEKAPYASNYKYMKIYYRAVESKEEDYLSIADYIWRWDSDWFWCSQAFYMQQPMLRALLGKWALHSKIYAKVMRFIKYNRVVRYALKKYWSSREWIIQDVAIPIDRALEYLSFFQTDIGLTPIWICPTYANNQSSEYGFFPMQPDQLYVNFGFWGSVPVHSKRGFYNRLIEQQVLACGGHKSLYSESYYTESEFWKIYNKEDYESLKQKYDPLSLFNSLYLKCITKVSDEDA